MKRIIIGIFAILSMAACNQQGKPDNGNPASVNPSADAGCPVNSVCKTLNGVDYYTDAQTKIANFKAAYMDDANRLRSVSEWYSRKDISDMLALLNHEFNAVDGVRIYFGAQSISGKQIKARLFLVTTKQRTPSSTDPTQSAHQDYYNHDGGYAIFSRETGSDLYNNTTEEIKEGGLLYGDTKPVFSSVPCTSQDAHMLDNNDAYNWVQQRHDSPYTGSGSVPYRDSNAYNTESEWFDICFINSLFTKIISDDRFNGLRIYSARGFLYQNKPKDVFILVPTFANGRLNQDYYDCLNLTYVSPCKVNDLDHNTFKELTPAELQERFNKDYLRKGNYMTGGYDKGELCPTICN